MTKWLKKGLIFPYTSELTGTISHCQYPCPILLYDDVYRIYFGSRDSSQNTIIFYFDYDLITENILYIQKDAILTKGPLGFFDQNGIYPSSVINKNGEFWLYTLGFTRGEAPLFYTRIGLAISKDQGKTYKKYSNAPLLNTSDYDPWMLTGPFVMFDDDIYRMWYVSGYKWDEQLNHFYHIKYAESVDGINWKREGVVSIPHAFPGETSIARPYILKEKGIYKAWYSYCCGNGYRIGYAESINGRNFTRKDSEANITLSDEYWENEALAYPAVIKHKGLKYMFYNGNKFGRDGIALAVEKL